MMYNYDTKTEASFLHFLLTLEVHNLSNNSRLKRSTIQAGNSTIPISTDC